MSVLDREMNFLSEDHNYYPSDIMRGIRNNKEEAQEIFRDALRKYADTRVYDNDTFIMNAILFEAEFHHTEVFPDVMKILSQPEGMEDRFGDVLTDCFPTAIYHLYNGDPEILYSVLETEAYEYIKSGVLNVISTLCAEGRIDRGRCRDVLSGILDDISEDHAAVYETAAYNASCLHFFELQEKIKKIYDAGLLDTMIFGDYEEAVDSFYTYETNSRNQFSIAPVMTVESELGRFIHFDGKKSMNEKFEEIAFEKALKQAENHIRSTTWKYADKNYFRKPKNSDKCPCGSGKLYKNCCKKKEGKPGSADYMIPYKTKMNFLESYPPLTFDPFTLKKTAFSRSGSDMRLLEDDYDREAIMIDVWLYMAMNRRVIRGFMATDAEKKQALLMFDEALKLYDRKIKKEGITQDEFDSRFGIHFTRSRWMRVYANLMDRYIPAAKMKPLLSEYFETEDDEEWDEDEEELLP